MARSTLDRIVFSKMTAAAKANSRRRTTSALVKNALLKNLIQRNPVHSGGLHRCRRDLR